MGILEYNSNNSGGSFWLKLEDWQALEEAGWIVHWIHNPDDPDHAHAEEQDNSWGEHKHSYSDPLISSRWNGQEWLGTPATSAALETNDPDYAIRQFELKANQNVDDAGCNCCGPPHSFTFTNDKGDSRYFDSYPSGYERGWS